jgi:hypothetical protein
MTVLMVDTILDPRAAQKLLEEAFADRDITVAICQIEEVGQVVKASDGYPWKRLSYTNERTLAQLPEGAAVYGEWKP